MEGEPEKARMLCEERAVCEHIDKASERVGIEEVEAPVSIRSLHRTRNGLLRTCRVRHVCLCVCVRSGRSEVAGGMRARDVSDDESRELLDQSERFPSLRIVVRATLVHAAVHTFTYGYTETNLWPTLDTKTIS